MTPPTRNLNYTSAEIHYETYRVVDSCEPIPPVCSEPEPMVILDEANQRCVMGVPSP